MTYHYSTIAEQVKQIAIEAGRIIVNLADSYRVEKKADASPVTSADIAANRYIVEQLQKLTSTIPVIAEENASSENQLDGAQSLFWLVDPLDGTKSFLRGEDTYTVNIALIENKHSIGGVVYCPAKAMCYFVGKDGKAYRQHLDHKPEHITTRAIPSEGITVLASSFHKDGRTEQFIQSLHHVAEVLTISSSYKLCLLAEGSADLYPRFAPTMEWDIAAGHALLKAAGGNVYLLHGEEMLYRKDAFRNGEFIAVGRKTAKDD